MPSAPHPFDGVDLRARPESYRIGRGEYGVFHAEPYKSELLPLWRLKTPAEAKKSAAAILKKFTAYRSAGDFVGMDVARKYLQMGYTRARRYAKYPGGRKRDSAPADDLDEDKQRSAQVFHEAWRRVANDPEYVRLKREFQRRA